MELPRPGSLPRDGLWHLTISPEPTGSTPSGQRATKGKVAVSKGRTHLRAGHCAKGWGCREPQGVRPSREELNLLAGEVQTLSGLPNPLAGQQTLLFFRADPVQL